MYLCSQNLIWDLKASCQSFVQVYRPLAFPMVFRSDLFLFLTPQCLREVLAAQLPASSLAGHPEHPLCPQELFWSQCLVVGESKVGTFVFQKHRASSKPWTPAESRECSWGLWLAFCLNLLRITPWLLRLSYLLCVWAGRDAGQPRFHDQILKMKSVL